MIVASYLRKLRAKTETGSLYAVAKLLGINENSVHNWDKGRSIPDAYACLMIARALGLPLEQVIADMEQQRDRDPARRAVWKKLGNVHAA